MKDKRTPGFYWVKTYDGDWIIVEWCRGTWWIPNTNTQYEDYEFLQIDETRLLDPDEAEKTK